MPKTVQHWTKTLMQIWFFYNCNSTIPYASLTYHTCGNVIYLVAFCCAVMMNAFHRTPDVLPDDYEMSETAIQWRQRWRRQCRFCSAVLCGYFAICHGAHHHSVQHLNKSYCAAITRTNNTLLERLRIRMLCAARTPRSKFGKVSICAFYCMQQQHMRG